MPKLKYPLPQGSDRGLHRVVFDFDGVLAEDTWPKPSTGAPIPEGVQMLKFYADRGFECVIHTSRPASHTEMIWGWIYDNQLEELVYTVLTDKVGAWLYIDDRGFRFER